MPKRNIAIFLSTILTVAFALSMTACATVEGAGKDIESGGEWIQEKAE